MQVRDFKKFDYQNPSLGVNVFRLGKTKEDCRQVYISNNFKKDHKVTIINLGLLIEGDNSHYVLIKHLSRLYTKSRRTESHICYNCMNGFSTEQARDNHLMIV